MNRILPYLDQTYYQQQQYGYGFGMIGANVGQVAPIVPAGNTVTVTPVSPTAGQRVTASITLRNVGNAPLTITGIVVNLITPATRVVQGHIGQLVVGTLPAAVAPNGTATFQVVMVAGIATTAELPAVLDVVWEISTTAAGVFIFATPGAINVPAPTFGVQMTSATFGVVA